MCVCVISTVVDGSAKELASNLFSEIELEVWWWDASGRLADRYGLLVCASV